MYFSNPVVFQKRNQNTNDYTMASGHLRHRVLAVINKIRSALLVRANKRYCTSTRPTPFTIAIDSKTNCTGTPIVPNTFRSRINFPKSSLSCDCCEGRALDKSVYVGSLSSASTPITKISSRTSDDNRVWSFRRFRIVPYSVRFPSITHYLRPERPNYRPYSRTVIVF